MIMVTTTATILCPRKVHMAMETTTPLILSEEGVNVWIRLPTLPYVRRGKSV